MAVQHLQRQVLQPRSPSHKLPLHRIRPHERHLLPPPQRSHRQQRRCYRMGRPAAMAPPFAALQGSTAGIGAFLETAPPQMYLVYMLAAGIGLPCSEDALVVWVGSGIFTKRYGGTGGIAQVLAIVYFGVVVSDMVTFYVGAVLRRGLFAPLKRRLFKDPGVVDRAEQTVQRWSKLIGLVQRFSLGFRGPLCLVAGFLGVKPLVFASGAAAGAVGTMALQLLAGYLLRHSANAYLAALALVAAPNLIGHLAGPVLTALGLWQAGRAPASDGASSGDPGPVAKSGGGSRLAGPEAG